MPTLADTATTPLPMEKTAAQQQQQQHFLHSSSAQEDGSRLLFSFSPNSVLAMTEETRRSRCGCELSWKEARTQAKLAGPLIIGNLLSFFLQMVSLTFVGHCGELELSGASIANSFAVVTGFSVVRAILVLNMTSIPLAMVWANMERVLLLLGQDAEIARNAGAYALWIIPTLFASSTSQPFAKFLQSQSLVTPLFLISLISLIFHVPVCWYLVFHTGLGYIGAAIANSISYWFNVLLLFLYVCFSPACAKSRAPPSWRALDDVTDFLRLAIPSAAMICLEWWSYEVLVIISGLLTKPELQTAAISICVSTESLIYMIPFGLGVVSSHIHIYMCCCCLQGLWIGLTLGCFVQFLSFLIITHFTDWRKEAEKAMLRVDVMTFTSPTTEPLLVTCK